MSKSPVSLLQEYYVKKGNSPPNYLFLDVGSLLTPQFKCLVSINGTQVEATACSKKLAKHNTALKVLQLLQVPDFPQINNNPPVNKTEVYIAASIPSPDNTSPGSNHVGMLNEYASAHGYQYPTYDQDIHFSLTQPTITIHCKFLGWTTMAVATNKKVAKQDAAFKMLAKLKDSVAPSTPNAKTNMVPKKLNLDDHEAELEIVLDQFKKLSVTALIYNNNRDENEPVSESDFHTILRNLHVASDIHSLNEIVRQLQMKGVHIHTFQKKPLILKTRIPASDKILFSYGDSFEEATRNMLKLLKKILL